MALLALIIAAALIVSAVRNTHGDLLAAVRTDVPAFAIWGAAIFGVACIGFVPGLKPVSRGLLALLIVVLILSNYRNVLAAFQGVAYGAPAQAAGGLSTGSLGGSGAMDNGKLLSSLSSLVGSLGSGASGDYSSFFGSDASPPSATPGAGSGATSAASLAYDDAADYGAAKRGSMAAMVVEAVVAPVRAVVSAVSEAVTGGPTPAGATWGGSGVLSLSSGGPSGDYGPSPVTAADPLGTAGAARWQKDTFAFEAANLASLVAAGQISKSDPGYQSKLDYLANLTGGVATKDAEMAKLKAMGL